MKKLESIKEHEKKFWESFKNPDPTQVMSGVACPTCGEELAMDTSLMLTSLPPQYRVYCKCGYVGSVH